jgi:hypothetical protein
MTSREGVVHTSALACIIQVSRGNSPGSHSQEENTAPLVFANAWIHSATPVQGQCLQLPQHQGSKPTLADEHNHKSEQKGPCSTACLDRHLSSARTDAGPSQQASLEE